MAEHLSGWPTGQAKQLAVRLLLGCLTVLAVLTLTFVLQYAVPGDVARSIAGPRATPQLLAQIRDRLHLDAPLWDQYWRYLRGVLSGNLGESYVQKQPVRSLIAARLPATLLLGVTALVVEIALGGALGVWEALRGRRSTLLTCLNTGLLATPTFALGYLFLLVFAYQLAVLPITTGADAAHLVMPAVVLGLSGVPYYSSVVRDSMTATLASSHVRTAVAKGLPRWTVIRRHVLRCALSPVVTMAGMDIAVFLSGVVFVENVFGWPGIGQLQDQAFNNSDRPLLMGTVIVAAVLVVFGNLLADVIRVAVDPRARQEASA
jgi:ABC-type dipeptide/oligopeptide/nickel transport system permease component